MSRLQKYLIEKTFAIDKDVEWLYDQSGLDELFTAIKNRDAESILRFQSKSKEKSNFGGDWTFFETDSSKLKNRNSKQAHKVNPVKIRIGNFWDGSFYDPTTSIIQISIHQGAMKLISDVGGNIDMIKNIVTYQFKKFTNEFSPAAFKGTISHELTHWIDDSLNNRHITNIVNIAKEKGSRGVLTGKHNDVNHTEFEINSQVHAIKSIKKELGKREFDKLNWVSLFQQKSSLMANFRNFRNEEEYNVHMKEFIKRLHREKLLPKSLQRIPSWSEMNKILRSV